MVDDERFAHLVWSHTNAESASSHKGNDYQDLICAWLQMDDSSDEMTTRNLAHREQAVVPVLMCPDDADFSCTIIVVEVVKSKTVVSWNRVGLLTDASTMSAEWFADFPTFKFLRSQYEGVVKAFFSRETHRGLPLKRNQASYLLAKYLGRRCVLPFCSILFPKLCRKGWLLPTLFAQCLPEML